MADLTQLSTEKLHEGYREYSAEVNRRHELKRIPEQITELADQYEAGGGSRQELLDALTTKE